jgi:predicted PurR-regulated permease PerM
MDEPSTRDEQPTAELPFNTLDAAVVVIGVVAAVYFLNYAQPLLIPVMLAILMSLALTPLVNGVSRILWRSLAAGVVLLVFVGTIAFGAWSVSDEVLQVVENLPVAAKHLRETVRRDRQSGGGTLQKMQQAANELQRTANEASNTPAAVSGAVQRVQVVQPPFSVTSYVWWGGMGLAGFVGQLLMILFLAYFLLASGDLYKRKLVKIAGPTLTHRKITVKIIDDINSQIQRYLLTLIITSAVVGTLTCVALWMLGLDAWLVWGIAAGIFNTIPYFGPVIVSAGLAVVGYLQFGTLSQTAAVAGVAMAITSLEGWLITPQMMGRAARMNPAAVFIGLLFWGWVWGLWGVVLAVPMMMLLKSTCDYIEDLQPIAELLGD